MSATATRSTSAKIGLTRAASAKCAHSHFGTWSIEPRWFAQTMSAIRAGIMKPLAFDDSDDGSDDDDDSVYSVSDGIATICIDGQMTKGVSSFGGCSTIQVRQAVRLAMNDATVSGIMLHVCSPGGTVSGTADLADDVKAARARKPVYAFIADMGCSAAYWVASQAETIYANVTAIVGSIGTYTVLEDDTGSQEQIGVKYRTVSTGEYKGLGADGKVTDALVADVQREVNELNAPFLAAVAAGRAGKIDNIATVSDGRAYAAAQAKQLGLIDNIASFDAAMNALMQRTTTMPSSTTFVPPTTAAKHGGAGSSRPPAAPPAASPAPIDPKAKAKAEWAAMSAAAKDKWFSEDMFVIARVREMSAGTAATSETPEDQAESAAKLDWAANKNGCQSDYLDEAAFVTIRKLEAAGRIRATSARS